MCGGEPGDEAGDNVYVFTFLRHQLDWVTFVSTILNGTVNVTGSEEIIVQTPTYFDNLTQVFDAANERCMMSV